MLPNKIQTTVNENGFSLYENIMIIGEKAIEKNFISYIDKLPKKIRESLLLVFQDRDTIGMIYK